MKRKIIFSALLAVFVSFGALAACAEGPAAGGARGDGVVRAFNAVQTDGITKTASISGDKYLVTVIGESSATEYTVGADFKVDGQKDLLGGAAAAAEEQSPLERAYAAAIDESGIDPSAVTGFDFDIDKRMGVNVYKVEIEEAGAKYKFVFKADDMSVLSREIEFENDLPAGTYIGEAAAKAIALEASAATEEETSNLVIREFFESGRKIYGVCFDYQGCRYEVRVDAVEGIVVKISKSVLGSADMPAGSGSVTAEEAKEIALGFVFGEGAAEGYSFRQVKPDYEDGRFVYEIELVVGGAEYEFEISAVTGEILDVDVENDGYRGENLPADKRFISRAEAVAAVEKAAGGEIYVVETEIEYDRAAKKYYYEVDIIFNGAGLEYYVDALTGEAVLREGYSAETVVTQDVAYGVALAYFKENYGLDEAAITNRVVKLERDDGRYYFEVKIFAGQAEYKAEVDAYTCEIFDVETERNENVAPSTGVITEQRAKELALGAAGGNAVVVDVDFEYENGRYFYEVEILADGVKRDYYVDASTGEVSLNENFVDGGSATLTREQVLEIAYSYFKVSGADAVVHKVKLGRDDGRLCYEIEFYIGRIEYEIDIDAQTGAVLEAEYSYD